MPHQLEPALAVLAGHGSRVLLADAVGLGKTVQAGLLLAELRRRGAVQSALVLTPAGLRDQWRRELSLRFGIAADIIDSPTMEAIVTTKRTPRSSEPRRERVAGFTPHLPHRGSRTW